MIEDITKEAMSKMLAERERRLEYVLRHRISRPIKGEITRRKVKLRGLRLQTFPESWMEERPDGSMILHYGERAYIEEPNGRKIDIYEERDSSCQG